jgi:hypothetical protein
MIASKPSLVRVKLQGDDTEVLPCLEEMLRNNESK